MPYLDHHIQNLLQTTIHHHLIHFETSRKKKKVLWFWSRAWFLSTVLRVEPGTLPLRYSANKLLIIIIVIIFIIIANAIVEIIITDAINFIIITHIIIIITIIDISELQSNHYRYWCSSSYISSHVFASLAQSSSFAVIGFDIFVVMNTKTDFFFNNVSRNVSSDILWEVFERTVSYYKCAWQLLRNYKARQLYWFLVVLCKWIGK